MHILMFLASTGRGGAESLVVNLCNQLIQKHQVTVLCFEESEWIDKLNSGVERVSIGRKKSRHNLLLYFRIARSIKRINPDLLHAHGAKAAFILKKLEKKLSVPLVATKHNSRKGEVFNRISHVVAVSGEVASTIRHEVAVIYNGVNARLMPASELSANEFRILAVGRLDEIKGFDVLVAAMHKLPGDISLQIAGEGEKYDALQKQIAELGLESRVSLLGYQGDIPPLMADSHVVIISSHSEGFSLVLVESFFYANVLLSTKVGGAEEVLPDALLFDHEQIADKIKSVKDNYLHYKSLFTDCKLKYSERFTVENMADNYERFYFNVLGVKSDD
ncbi:MAG: glycosyltransferase [Gammaproteobacteria bacterium]|nr:glycosyltransferase [Gammaproteobacteria bacterium]